MDWAQGWGPSAENGTGWRGEFVKTGPKSYDWTTMALAVGGEGFPFPFALGFCPWTAEFTGCDSWQGEGICSYYGFFSFDQDPFEEGILLFDDTPGQAFFERMPMTPERRKHCDEIDWEDNAIDAGAVAKQLTGHAS